MKRCPECRRDYYDETLLYCLDDGTPLLDGPALQEPLTQIYTESPSSPGTTRPQIHATDQATGPSTTGMVRPQSERRVPWITVAIAILLVCAAGAGFWYSRSGTDIPLRRSSASIKVSRLTSTGNAGLPAISPDGKYVIYTLWDGGKGTLWLRQVSSTSAVPLFQPSSETVGFGGRTFSPSGEMVYFVFSDKDEPRGALMEIPTLGGTPRRLLSDIASGISFAPDGRTFVFRRQDESKGSTSLVIASLDGTPERILSTRSGNDWFNGEPSWSPDGKMIAAAIGSDTGGSHLTIAGISVDTGQLKPITDKQWNGDLGKVEWLRDGSGLIALAGEIPVVPMQIWFVGYPSGHAERLTADVEGYDSISLAADGTTMAARKNDFTQRVWVAPMADTTKAKQITSGKYDGRFGLSWTPDGRLLYTVTNGENIDLAVVNADGSGQRTLNADAAFDLSPSSSADGKYIYFGSDRETGLTHIWRMNAEGTAFQQITSGDAGDNIPACSPDGKWIVFSSWRSGKNSLWRVSTAGGDPELVADVPTYASSFVGPEEAVIQYSDGSVTPPRQRGAVINVRTRELSNTFDYDRLYFGLGGMPGAFLYIDVKDGVNNVWARPFNGGPPKAVTSFRPDPPNNSIFRFAVSQDQKFIAFSRGNSNADVVLIKDFR